MMIRKISFLTVLTVLTYCQLAAAEPAIVEEEVTLRISKQATAEEIYQMLGMKAKRVCDSRDVYEHTNVSGEAQCRKQFVQDAVTAINRPALTALHRERTGSETFALAASDR